MRIERLTLDTASAHLSALIHLLRDSVDGGASIGFIPPLSTDQAEAFWSDVFNALRAPYRVLLVAVDEDEIVGTVQLDYSRKTNATHRAEVIKLLVLTSARRRGIGRALMQEAARVAQSDGRTLLYLDTQLGDPAEQLYSSLGYTKAGVIPRYVFDASGDFHATVIMYMQLV